MRIITGTARGRKLRAPEGTDVRPTSDMVKEAMFSVIQFDIPASKVLDLFSGSGQLGIEALSRGAASCTFVDSSRASLEITKENIAAAGFESSSDTVLSDSAVFIENSRGIHDIVFLDPPYKKGLIEKVLPAVSERLSERGVIVCEHERGLVLPESCGTAVKKKTYRYGKIEVTVYRKSQAGESL